MKKKTHLIPVVLIAIFLSFNFETKAVVLKNISTNETLVLDCIEFSEIEKPLIIIDKSQDCIFDQATQTDDFLKGIEELENYIWDNQTKTAEIVLNDHLGLSIKRGGCDYLEMTATFYYDRILDVEKDKDIIFDNIIWITSLLEEFDGDDIKKAIEENKVVISKIDEFNYYANFMDKKLYELYYFNLNNKNQTNFNIGYYYN